MTAVNVNRVISRRDFRLYGAWGFWDLSEVLHSLYGVSVDLCEALLGLYRFSVDLLEVLLGLYDL